MARKMFSLSELRNLDFGKMDAAFQRELAKIIDDIVDRPEDDRPRRLLLRLAIIPEEITAGTIETVTAGFEVAAYLPTRRSRPYSMRVTKNGLIFNSEAPENPDQMTLDEVNEH
jgi:hypothetical protein